MIGNDASKSTELVGRWRAVAGWDGADASLREELEAIVRSALAPEFPGGILPVPANGARRAHYFAIARTQSEWRRLRPLLLAWAGPSVTDFDGSLMRRYPEWAERHGFQCVARLEPSAATEPFVRRSLKRMCDALHGQVAAARRPPEPTSRLLGRLDGALADGDRAGALELYQRLRAEHRLDGLNLAYLRIQIDAAFGDWNAILAMPELSDIVESPRPRSVSAAILEAIFTVHLASLGDRARWEAVPESLTQTVRTLLAEPRPTIGPGARVLAALLDGTNVAREGAVPVQASAATALAVEPTGERAKSALIAAMLSPSLELLGAAVEAVDDLDPFEREDILAPRWIRVMWQDVARRSGRVVPPQTWVDWLERLTDPEAVHTLEMARAAADQWITDEQLGDPAAVASFAAAVESVPVDGLAAERLAEAVPVLARWLRASPGFPNPSLLLAYDALWTRLVLSIRRGQAELESASTLFEAMLACGVPARRYAELLLDALAIVKAPGRRSVYWLLAAVEATLEEAAPDDDARQRFLVAAFTSLAQFAVYISPLQRSTLAALASALGIPLPTYPEAVATAETEQSVLDGAHIAIYTLTESAGRQAAEIIVSLVPSARVSLHNDHVGSAPLRAAAENADVFVVVSASAAHAATDVIQRHRGNKPLLYAAGRGASSIVRALDEYAAPGGIFKVPAA